MNNKRPNKAILLFDSIPSPPFDIINPKSQRVIAIISEEHISILDKRVKELVYHQGINIPPFLRERFNDASLIEQEDPLFYEAFITAECWNLRRSGYKIKKTERD